MEKGRGRKGKGAFGELYGVSGIYKITNKVNGNCYVGKSLDVRLRLIYHRQEIHKGYRGNRRWAEDIQKYGTDVFEFSLLEAVPTKEYISMELSLAEERWYFKERAYYNLTRPQLPKIRRKEISDGK